MQEKFADMKTLNLQHFTRLTDQGLLKILSMCGNNLQDLDISFTDITGQGLDEVQGKFGKMKELNLQNCTRVTNQGLLKLLRICGNKVQLLNISATQISGQGLDQPSEKFVNLKTLNLHYCSRLTDQGLLKILKICGSKLQNLDISRTNITGKGLDQLQGKFSDLNSRDLELAYCSRLTDQGRLEVLGICGSKL